MRAHTPWHWRRLAIREPLRRWPAFLHWSTLLAIALPVLVFVLQRDVGLSLEDEGFVWYGAQRVLAGEVPLRDFQAYDIARYYWYAAWMWAVGHAGIVPLRAASTALAAMTGVLAIALVRTRGRQTRPALVLAAVTFSVWMVPYYKVADSFAVLLLLAALAWLLREFSLRRCVTYGVCLGVAATIGINHGLYGVISLALALVWLHATGRHAFAWSELAAVACGVAVGYLPMLVLLVAMPGFASGFFDSIRILFEIRMTNLELPMPSVIAFWQNKHIKPTSALTESVMGLSLWAACVFLGVCGWRVLRGAAASAAGRHRMELSHATCWAAVLTSLPYAHYFWSRADIVHMAVSVLPVLVAVWTFPHSRSVRGERWRVLALGLVMLCSGILGGPQHQIFQLLKRTKLQEVVVAGDVLRVRPDTAAEVRLIQGAVDAHAGNGGAIYVVPYWPGAYAITLRRAPTWEIYQIFPASLPRQRREIERLSAADIRMAMVLRHRADNRADLGFAQTHGAIARHLEQCLTRVSSADAARLNVVLYAAPGPSCGQRMIAPGPASR